MRLRRVTCGLVLLVGCGDPGKADHAATSATAPVPTASAPSTAATAPSASPGPAPNVRASAAPEEPKALWTKKSEKVRAQGVTPLTGLGTTLTCETPG